MEKMKRKGALSILIVATVFVSVSSMYAQQTTKTSGTAAGNNEWLQFRGPNGAGTADGFSIPTEFNSKKNLAWKAAVPFARSSPVVTADRIFLTASESDKLITIALDRK